MKLLAGVRVVATGGVFLVVWAGCAAPGSGQFPSGSSEATASHASAPSTSGSPGSAETPTACPAPLPSTILVGGGEIPDGKSFGLVHHFDGVALYVDPAEFFGNEDAVKAAREDGEIGPDEDLPNPFYIRNPDKTIVRVPISAKLRVSLLNNDSDRGPTLKDRAVAELASLYCSDTPPDWVYSGPQELPTNLKVVKGELVGFEQQYLP